MPSVVKMFNSAFLNRTLCVVVLSFLSNGVCAQLAVGEPVMLSVNAKQQISLGVQVAALHPAESGQLLVSATVVTPPGKEFTVSAPYAGQVSRMLVGVGDSFKVGAPLAHFTSPMLGEARRLLNEASIDFKNATAAAERDQVLFNEGIIPAVRLQLSRSKQEASQAQLRAREADLSASGMHFDSAAGYATGILKAPLSGTVLEAFSAVGQRVEAGVVLFKLADDSQLQLDLQLSSDKAAQIKVGDEVSLVARNAKAKIIGVSRAVDTSQLARARAVVTTRGSLHAGELVSVTVHAKGVSNTAKSDTYWLIPTRAMTQWQDHSWVFVVNDKGFEAKRVTVISSSDEMSMIELALPRGGKVAITGIASLRAMLQ